MSLIRSELSSVLFDIFLMDSSISSSFTLIFTKFFSISTCLFVSASLSLLIVETIVLMVPIAAITEKIKAILTVVSGVSIDYDSSTSGRPARLVRSESTAARTAADATMVQFTSPRTAAVPIVATAVCAIVFIARVPAAAHHFLFVRFVIFLFSFQACFQVPFILIQTRTARFQVPPTLIQVDPVFQAPETLSFMAPEIVSVFDAFQPDVSEPFLARTRYCTAHPAPFVDIVVAVNESVVFPLVAVLVTLLNVCQPLFPREYWRSYPVITPEAPLQLIVTVSPSPTRDPCPAVMLQAVGADGVLAIGFNVKFVDAVQLTVE